MYAFLDYLSLGCILVLLDIGLKGCRARIQLDAVTVFQGQRSNAFCYCVQMSVEVILKVYTKPATKSDLVAAINKFWLEGSTETKIQYLSGCHAV